MARWTIGGSLGGRGFFRSIFGIWRSAAGTGSISPSFRETRMWIIRVSGTRSSPGFSKRKDSAWESSPSRTGGRHKTFSPSAVPASASSYRPATSIPWCARIRRPEKSAARTHTLRAARRESGRTGRRSCIATASASFGATSRSSSAESRRAFGAFPITTTGLIPCAGRCLSIPAPIFSFTGWGSARSARSQRGCAPAKACGISGTCEGRAIAPETKNFPLIALNSLRLRKPSPTQRRLRDRSGCFPGSRIPSAAGRCVRNTDSVMWFRIRRRCFYRKPNSTRSTSCRMSGRITRNTKTPEAFPRFAKFSSAS